MKELKREVATLRHQADAELHLRGAMNSGCQVSVDYFALRNLINYFDETQDAALRVAKARDLLENVMFSVNPGRAER